MFFKIKTLKNFLCEHKLFKSRTKHMKTRAKVFSCFWTENDHFSNQTNGIRHCMHAVLNNAGRQQCGAFSVCVRWLHSRQTLCLLQSGASCCC